MKTGYSYGIIKYNYPELERENALLENKYKASKRYALITKVVHKDHSENITTIEYSNSLEELHNKADQLVSWYNYPIGLTKNIQGYITKLS